MTLTSHGSYKYHCYVRLFIFSLFINISIQFSNHNDNSHLDLTQYLPGSHNTTTHLLLAI